MHEFVELLRAKESWLMERILGYARESGYTRYSSTLLEAWRISIAGLTAAMASALEGHGGGLFDIGVDTDWQDDAAVRFAMVQARRHRQRGIPLGMFLGLFVYYRQTYRDLVNEFVPLEDDRARLDGILVALFDRMTIGFCTEWADVGVQASLAEMASTLRDMTNEKNRYLTFFESLSTPAIFIDPDGVIGNLNSAAASLLDSAPRAGKCYYSLGEGAESAWFRGRHVADVFPWLQGVVSSAPASMDGTIKADVVQPLPFGERHFLAVLNRHPDVSGRVTGFSLILNDQTDIIRAQEHIKRAKEELDSTFETISDLVFLVDGNLTMLRVNKALADHLGCPGSEIIGRPCVEVLGDADHDYCGGDDSERRLPVTFGKIPGKFLVKRDVLRGPDGSPSGAVFVAREVTVLERIRETLLDIEDKYRNIFENAPVGIFQISPHGFLSVNKALAFIFGFDSADEMRRHFTDIPSQLYVRQEDREGLLREATTTGLIRDRDLQLQRKDGEPFWAKVNGRLVFEEDGEIEYCEGFVQDVTELRSFLDRLTLSEKQFRGLAETMQQGLVQVDAQGRVIFCNRHFCDMLRRECGELLGLELATLVHPDDRDVYRCASETAGCGEEARHSDIRWLVSGSQIFSIVTPVTLENGTDGCAGVWLLVMDVTQRRLMEAQMLQNQKMEAIGQLAAGIAHEINTPTQYVLNYAWFIKEALQHITQALDGHEALFERLKSEPGLEGDIAAIRDGDVKLQIPFYLEELPAAMDDVMHGLEKITSIVGSVKQFVHPGHDGKTDVDLNKLVTDTVNLSRNEWKYMAELSLSLDPGLPPVPCLSQEIGQVLLNLLVNAAHAISDARRDKDKTKGRIHVSTRLCDGCVEIRVEDTGTGMPQHVQEHAFEPFFTTKAVGTGTGQGLFIAHRIVTRSHGGSINFESTPGKGTTFTVSLPLKEPV